MLVLHRGDDEGFWVGKDVHIKISDIRRHRVSVVISAPPEVKIFRDELVIDGMDWSAARVPPPKSKSANKPKPKRTPR